MEMEMVVNEQQRSFTPATPELESMTNLGCVHYKRSCKIRSPCCNEIFNCRHCHNEAKNSMDIADPLHRHDIPRHEVTKVICSLCDTEQSVQQHCSNCGVCMGNYFCPKCKLFDHDVSKEQYHCDECGICRIGGMEHFFHCQGCGCCYSKTLMKDHQCVERALHHNCPVCFEFLFDTLKTISVLPCAHTIHLECVTQLMSRRRYSCPICSKSICDMSRIWERIDIEVALTPMPEIYQDKMVWILCNDCGEKSEVQFHVVGLKCKGTGCNSYNTRQIEVGGCAAPSGS